MRKEFYDMKIRSILVLVVMIVIFFSVAPLQNYAVNIVQKYGDLLRGYDRNLLKNWNFYIYSQWFGKNFGQLVPIIAIVFAFPLFSREYENGTMEFLLTRKSRNRVFLEKLFTSLLVLIVEIAFLSILPALYSLTFSKPLNYNLTWKFLIQSEVGAILWFSVAFIASTFYDDQVKPVILSLGTLGITTAAGFIKPLRFLNTYTYILGTNIFKGNEVDVARTVGFLVASLVLLYSSYWVFKRKEV